MSRYLPLGIVVLAILPVLAAVSRSASADEQAPGLKKGDRIVFLGDSITQAGVEPKGYVTVIKNALEKKHKDLEIEVIGAGISGNKVPDLQARVDKDVIAKKPTVVVIYIGINDVWHGEKDPARGTSKEAFAAGLKEVIGKCTSAGARVVLCTPSVIGEKTGGANPLDKQLDEYSEISRGLAKDLKLTLCDLRKEFVELLKTRNNDNKESGILTSDRVHLNDTGNYFVAHVMLKSLGAQ